MGRTAKSNNGRISWIASNGQLSEYGPDSPKFTLTGRDTLHLLQVLESGVPATSTSGATTWELIDGRLKETYSAVELLFSKEDTITLTELLTSERLAIEVAAELEEMLRSENNREIFPDEEEDEEDEDDEGEDDYADEDEEVL